MIRTPFLGRGSPGFELATACFFQQIADVALDKMETENCTYIA